MFIVGLISNDRRQLQRFYPVQCRYPNVVIHLTGYERKIVVTLYTHTDRYNEIGRIYDGLSPIFISQSDNLCETSLIIK